MTRGSDTIDAAIAWHFRLREGNEEDWLAFAAWLEADPERSGYFDEVAAVDQILPLAMESAAPLSVVAVNDDQAPGRGLRALGWLIPSAGAAAALALALGTSQWRSVKPAQYVVAAPPGQHRQVIIADGSTALLSGGTRLILDRNNPRFAKLATGEAVFMIRHDSSKPFSVAAGDHTVEDVGTTFNLLIDPGRFSLEVLSGAVLFDPERSSTRLMAGQTLIANRGSNPVIARKNPAGMASWRHGELSYSGVLIQAIARDLSRNLGTQIVAGPDVSNLPFTGTIHLDANPADTVKAFSSTIGVEFHHDGQRWVIGRLDRAGR